MKPVRRDFFPRIEQYINEYKENNGTAPSIKEIAAILNVSNATAWRYVQRMSIEGLLEYQGGYGRISTKPNQKESDPTQAIPSVGSISCGLPLLAEENIVHGQCVINSSAASNHGMVKQELSFDAG